MIHYRRRSGNLAQIDLGNAMPVRNKNDSECIDKQTILFGVN